MPRAMEWSRCVTLGVLLFACAAALAQPAASDTRPDPTETRRLHELFDADWQWRMRTYPEWATYRGDHRYGDRLNDRSRQAEDAAYAYARERLARQNAIDREKLSAADRVSYDILRGGTLEWLEGEQYPGLRTRAVDAMGGLHLGFPALLRVSRVASEEDVRKVLARFAAFPHAVDQVIERLREGIATRWVTFRPSMLRVPGQIDGLLAEDTTKSPLYEPFTHVGRDLPEGVRLRLASEGARAVREEAYPALRKLRRFIADEYLPRAPADGAMSTYPGGAAAYEYLVRTRTTTTLGAREIHAIGLREVARLRAEMETQMKLSGFKGSFAQFIDYLHGEPRFFHTDAESMLAAYRDIAKRVDPELPKLFAELPRAPYGIRSIPAHQGPGAPENYEGPSVDGTRPGWFNANTVALKERPTWGMESLFAHEAVPGHHLQIARSVEMRDLPMFRRGAGYVAYVEGWALYAETLGDQLGLYKEPYSRFGHLQWQIFRAARLAVDTGIHALGWKRDQAIEWMTERTGFPKSRVEAEVDRYYVWPAQALGYMLGALKIAELRDRAKAALGERFDIRRFHVAVLDTGAVPLPVLEQRITEWIAEEKAAVR